MANRTENNFKPKFKQSKIPVVCSKCGSGDRQLFRMIPKEKGKHKSLKFEFYKNTGYICVDCR